MTIYDENSNKFLFTPIISGLLLIVVAAVLVWATQVRPTRQAAEQPMGEGVSSKTAASTQPLLGDPAQGQAKFAMTCSACHGPAGKGIPGAGKDLTTSEFVSGKVDGELIDFIKVGRRPSDPLNTTGIDMPPKGGNPALNDQDIQNIVSYLRTLQK